MYSYYLHAISVACRSSRSNNSSNPTNCYSLLSANALQSKVDENKQIVHLRMVAGPGIRGIIAK